jgi:hypothetical protein
MSLPFSKNDKKTKNFFAPNKMKIEVSKILSTNPKSPLPRIFGIDLLSFFGAYTQKHRDT